MHEATPNTNTHTPERAQTRKKSLPHVFNRGRFAISRVFLQAYSKACFLSTQLHRAVMYTVYKRNIDPVDSQNTFLSGAKRLFQSRFISDLRGSRSSSGLPRLSELLSCFGSLIFRRDSRLRSESTFPLLLSCFFFALGVEMVV